MSPRAKRLVVLRVREVRLKEPEDLVPYSPREGRAQVTHRGEEAVGEALIALVRHLHDDEGAHHEVRGRGDLI